MSSLSASHSALVKPSLDTRFHIDFSWWEREGRELRVDVLKHLRPESQEAFAAYTGGETIDVVDPETAEVRVVDKLQHMLRTQCKPLEAFQSEHTSLVDAVFHVFLLNGNQPLSPQDLGERVSRPAQTILRTLAGRVVYKGLRPVADEA
ncbi:MAG: hypothetical protein JNK29_10175 [Anaerolineales bacterium]|nr:hypothetical protein [Anaerolineales bacterium]